MNIFIGLSALLRAIPLLLIAGSAAAGSPPPAAGVNLSGGEYGQPGGVLEKDYHYPGEAELVWAKTQGFALVRLPFLWERLQPKLNGELDAVELKRLSDVVARARALGLTSILDAHNYAKWRGKQIGSPDVPASAFADFWRRLATHFGRDRDVIDAIGRSAGDALLDVHTDADHHRSVLTLLGKSAPRAVARAAVERLDIRDHRGVHPRIGVVDVVPFVALAGSTPADALAARDAFCAWAADELAVPCFRYGPERTLPDIRRGAFTSLAIGETHGCFVDGASHLACFGSNALGQLGVGSRILPDCGGTCSTAPQTLVDLVSVHRVAVGRSHTCATLLDGTARCFGSDAVGQLGNSSQPVGACGAVPCATQPVVVYGLSMADAIVARDDVTCVVEGGSTLECWGDCTTTQCGMQPRKVEDFPAQVYGLSP